MVNFMLNGEVVGVESDADTPLLWVLREELKLRGTKFGCGIAQCGACTVHIDGNPMRSCITPVSAVEGRSVTTIEGLATPVGEALKSAWTEAQVPQCGYCQSGQIMQAAGLLETNPSPSDDEIVNAMNGNLCRCMAYPRIKKAIKTAANWGGNVMKNQRQGLSRRSFIAGVAGSSLMMSMGSLVSGCSSDQASKALASGDLSKVFSPNIWFEINGAGDVLINIVRAEMGQHVGTSLAQIVADELGADWSKVSFKHVDTDPKWGVMVTGGSWSVHTSFTLLSQAGAAGRTIIIDAASKLMGVAG
jgi:aerobic-type carbon monoxide dehydrogenase small subunit (CoxS/CutS family)